MKKHLPDVDPKDIDGIAKDYMEYYQKETLNVAKEFKSDSAVVQNAVERATELHAKYHPDHGSSMALAT
jgi:hypothetical protein